MPVPSSTAAIATPTVPATIAESRCATAPTRKNHRRNRGTGLQQPSADDLCILPPAPGRRVQQAAAALARALPDPGIRHGERAPDFTLPDAVGKPVRLAEQLEQGPVVLVFYRGAWCPFCNLHLRSLHAHLPAIAARGARLLLVTPQRPDRSRAQLEEAGYGFEVLSDLDSTVMKAYRLYFELDPERVRVYSARGLNVEDFNAAGRNVLPVPATFVIDRGGIVRAMHADTDYRERMEPADIIRALDAL